MTSTTNGWLPSRADLDAATAATAAALASPAATPQDVHTAAEHEQEVHDAYLQRPGADAQLQAWAGEWAACYETRAGQTAEIELGA